MGPEIPCVHPGIQTSGNRVTAHISLNTMQAALMWRFGLLALFLVLLNAPSALSQPQTHPDYLSILKRASVYSKAANDSLPQFSFQSSRTPCLVALRTKYGLDSIAGFGNEVSRLINLLHWVHNTVKHDGQHESGITTITADSILTAAEERGVGVSCGELATTLNDCYLAMGWASRKVYCFPKDSLNTDHDSHVINAVYLSSKKKWIWMDPTNDAYIMDEHGDLLSIQEVRQRLISGKTLIVNPDANWNRRSSAEKSYYLDYYMAKNLYRFYSPLKSEYDYETRGQNKKVAYVYLFPMDYKKPMPLKTDDYYNADLKTTFVTYNLFNDSQFWQIPENE
jgi:hypothetical protein